MHRGLNPYLGEQQIQKTAPTIPVVKALSKIDENERPGRQPCRCVAPPRFRENGGLADMLSTTARTILWRNPFEFGFKQTFRGIALQCSSVQQIECDPRGLNPSMEDNQLMCLCFLGVNRHASRLLSWIHVVSSSRVLFNMPGGEPRPRFFPLTSQSGKCLLGCPKKLPRRYGHKAMNDLVILQKTV